MNFKFDKIRVLETGHNHASWNMALDEVLLNKLDEMPILRLYGWRPSAVSIGYFQSMDQEVDVNKCRHLGIDMVRRMTGGGAVFHDSELTYSFLTRKYPQSIMESYELICDAVILAINKLGFVSKFSPLNDITIDGKKVSGNAQTRKKNTLLQHGTILLNADIDKMFFVLKIPSEKIKDKMITDARQRITALNKTFDEATAALKSGFSEKFGSRLVTDTLTVEEETETEKLVREKYTTHQWNWKR
jgi:lipoate-protein ligase A